MKKSHEKLFQTGKLPPDVLFQHLKSVQIPDKRVVVGPAHGIDAAAIDFGDSYLLVSSDPITFTTDEIGYYAICVNGNDIAVMGGVPRWFFATLLLPEGEATAKLVRSIFSGLKKACKNAGVALCGGHTEITPSVSQPVICGTMIGEVVKKGLVTSAGARSGHAIILTKGAAIEGTAILARECEDTLRGKIPKSVLSRAKRFLHKPGISVVQDAQTALQCGKVSAMHDPTEGGVATGLFEIAAASKTGLIIKKENLPILKETRMICDVLGIDPLGLISSGALLIACAPNEAEKILAGLKNAGIEAAVIGKMLPSSKGFLIEEGGKKKPLLNFPRDELARFFSEKEE